MNKLHACCGPIKLEGWVNLDKGKEFDTDICADLLQTYFDENTFDAIYCCHGLEHFSYPVDTVELLNRFYKWLKPNGILRVAVPDLKKAVTAYCMGVNLNFLYGSDFKAYYHKDTSGERLNFFIKAWEHQHCFDFETLSLLFIDTGFKNIQNKQANESLIPGFNHDRFISESLYIEAQKL